MPTCLFPPSWFLPPTAQDAPGLPRQAEFPGSSRLLYGSRSLLERSKSDSNFVFSAPRASKSASRAYPEAFPAPSASMLRFGPRFGPVFVSKVKPGTLKINEFRETSSKFCDFALFSSSRLRDPILDSRGLRFGSLLAVKMAETSLGIPLGAAKSRSRDLFSGPCAVQERSKWPPRALQEASRRPRG